MSHENPLVGLDWLDDDPAVRISIGSCWRSMRPPVARILASQIMAMAIAIETAGSQGCIPYLFHAPEYGPFVETRT